MRSLYEERLDRLNHIAKIKERVADNLAFQNDEMLQVWVIHHLQVIGEAARGVSQPVRDRHPEVLWPQMTRKDLPKLEEQVQRIRAQTATHPR
jgi:uncharacterized protein with HEPN domain